MHDSQEAGETGGRSRGTIAMQYLTNVVEGRGVVLQERKQRPVFGFLMASRMSWLVQELRSSLKSFWSWQWWGLC